MRKLTKCMLCKSSLVLTRKAHETKNFSKEFGYVNRVGYMGDLIDNEYTCSNPKCEFHNAEDIRRSRPQSSGYQGKRPFNKGYVKPYNGEAKRTVTSPERAPYVATDKRPYKKFDNKDKKPYQFKPKFNPLFISKKDLYEHN